MTTYTSTIHASGLLSIVHVDSGKKTCGECGRASARAEWNEGAKINLCPACAKRIRRALGYSLDEDKL